MNNIARRLNENDANELRAIRLESLREHPLELAADYDDEAAKLLEYWQGRLQSQMWFGVEANGALVACASLHIPPGKKLKHNAWVHAMYARLQGGGAADALMDCMEQAAREQGASWLKLAVREGNTRAEAFYRRRGFVPYGREPDSHVVEEKGYASIELGKVLSAPVA